MSEGGGAETDRSGEADSGQEEEKLAGLELIRRQVGRLSELIQKEVESDEPNTAEEEEEFQGYMRGWVAEYQRLSQAGLDHQEEALEVLGMIRALLGDLPIGEELLPENIYDILPHESLDGA